MQTDESAPISTARRLHRWSRRDYHALADAGFLSEDDHVELIDGHIVHMSPQDTLHAVAVRLTRRVLQRIFSEEMYMVDAQLPLALGPHSEPEPDVCVVEGTPRDFVERHPTSAVIVVEVADTSLEFDRTQKKTLYARHSLPEYWILNVPDRQLEVYRNPAEGAYETVTIHGPAEIVSVEEETVPVSSLLP